MNEVSSGFFDYYHSSTDGNSSKWLDAAITSVSGDLYSTIISDMKASANSISLDYDGRINVSDKILLEIKKKVIDKFFSSDQGSEICKEDFDIVVSYLRDYIEKIIDDNNADTGSKDLLDRLMKENLELRTKVNSLEERLTKLEKDERKLHSDK